MVTSTGQPDDYSELFSTYFPYVKAQVAKAGIASEDVEDAAMEVMAKFMEKGALDWYEPDHVVDTGPTPRVPGKRFRTAKFGSLLRRFTYLYTLSIRDRQATKHKYEPARLQAEHPDGGTYADHLAATAYNPEDDWVTATDAMTALHECRACLKKQQVVGRRDLVLAFDVAVESASHDGKVDRHAIGTALGVSDTTVGLVMAEIRRVLADQLKAS